MIFVDSELASAIIYKDVKKHANVIKCISIIMALFLVLGLQFLDIYRIGSIEIEKVFEVAKIIAGAIVVIGMKSVNYRKTDTQTV